MRRSPMVGVLGALMLVGCVDMGLDGNIQREEAAQAAPSDLVVAVLTPTAEAAALELIVDGRLWVPSGHPVALRTDDLRPVGAASGHTVYARHWDAAPFDELYTRMEGFTPGPLTLDPGADRWQGYLPVLGGSGGPAGAGATSPAH